MNFYYIPDSIKNIIIKLEFNRLYEIRLRKGFPIKVNYSNNLKYLTKYGISDDKNGAIICDISIINEIIENLTERSFYAFNDYIKNGFLYSKNGDRIGICGECVIDNGQVITIKNISSLNIRVAHEIKGCSTLIINKLFSKNILNTLLISPPLYGKTTLLKDIIININDNSNKNILIIDERGEFNNITGENIDKISFSTKNYAYQYGIRNFSPDVIVMDELMNFDDWNTINFCINSGVKVIASCHGDDYQSVINKPFFNKGYFNRYVILTKDFNGEISYKFLDDNFYEL